MADTVGSGAEGDLPAWSRYTSSPLIRNFSGAGKMAQQEIEDLRSKRSPALQLRSFDTARMLLHNAADGFTGRIECLAVQQDLARNLEANVG